MPKRRHDLLLYLAGCSDLHLFLFIVSLRMLFLLYMVFCHRVFSCLFPRWLSGHGKCITLDYDSCGRLYEDQRLTEVRHWDGVHMYHIAYYGYTHETLFVFFPFIPFLIRFVRWCTVQAFPLLYRLAPVSFYISGLNVIASAGAGVVLRRLTVLTMLGPEVEGVIPLWRGHRREKHTEAARGCPTAAYETAPKRTHVRAEKAMPTFTPYTAGVAVTPPSCLWGSLRNILEYNQNATNPIYRAGDGPGYEDSGNLVHFPNALAAAAFRVMQGWHGTILDKLPPLLLTTLAQDTAHPARCQKGHSNEGMPGMQGANQGNTAYSVLHDLETAKEVSFRRRAVGGAVLVWMFTPAMVFTVANYTESFFSLFTILGIYSLACYRPPPKNAETGNKETEGVVVSRCSYPSLKPRDSATAYGESGCQDARSILWKPALTSWHEVVAVTCFVVSSCIRSNGLVCVGFLLYPTVLQVFFPQSYRERWEVLHGPCWASYASHTAEKRPPSVEAQPTGHEGDIHARTGITKATDRKVYVVRTLYAPTRFPHPIRFLILLFTCALVLIPYLSMGYVGWKRYSGLWSEEERRVAGNHFWKFYNVLQKKYWNVGFLRAYSVTNSPNVLIALPIGFIVGYTSYRYFFRLALHCDFWSHVSSLPGSGGHWIYLAAKPVQRAWLFLQVLIQSSNVIYLCALCLIAFTVMHVQVVNRFVMSSPALYWLIGVQFATKPSSRLTRFVLFYALVWGLTGGLLFSNFMPWT